MGEVIDLSTRKTKSKTPVPHDFMIGLSIFKDDDGMLIVDAEVGEGHEDFDIFEAIMAAAWQFAEEHGLVEETDNDYS